MSGLRLPHGRDLPLENVQCVLFVGLQILELHVLQNDFQRVADAAKLSPAAPDRFQDFSFYVGVGRAAEIDVDEPELSALLIGGDRIDRLQS